MVLLHLREAREKRLYTVIKQCYHNLYREGPQARTVLRLEAWEASDFITECWLYILSAETTSATRLREKFIEPTWSWYDLENQKLFRGYVKKEMFYFMSSKMRDNTKQVEGHRVPKFMFVSGEAGLVNIIYDRTLLENKMHEEVLSKKVSRWIEEECNAKEQFIYWSFLNVMNLDWEGERGKRRLQNYPGGSVTEKTFYAHRRNFTEKLRAYMTGEINGC